MSSVENPRNRIESKFRPVDIATLGYILIEFLLIFVFQTDKPGWPNMALFYGSSACIVLLIVYFPLSDEISFWRGVRNLYPLFLFIFFYKAIEPQIYIVFDMPFDWIVHGIESSILGNDLSFMLQRYMDIWLNELMSFAYVSYYFQLPVAAGLFIALRKWNSLEKTILSASITFYICYILFIFFPVAGPRFYLSDQYYLPLIGPLFTPLSQKIIEIWGFEGAAMPSSHCAVALVVAWRIARDLPGLAIPAILLLILLCVGTVYGRYHYLTDVLFGLIIGAFGLWITNRWKGSFLKGKESTEQALR